MATTAEQLSQIPGPARRLFRIWQQLPQEPLSQSEMDTAIIKAANLYEGDLAAASAFRSTLTLAEAVTARRGEDGEIAYQRTSEFPVHGPTHPGSESFNRQLEQQATWEREQHAERDRAVQAAVENGSFGQQRRELLVLIDQRGRELFEEMFAERMGEMRRAQDSASVQHIRALREPAA
jgi:hypothetical protein